jgi:hypothetical protein
MIEWAEVGPSDAELFVRLADALVPGDVKPTEAGLAHLRATLDARSTWPAGPVAAHGAKKRRSSWTGRTRRGLVALGLIGGISVGGTGVAVAAGASLPEPVRVVALHLGFPVGPTVTAQHHENGPRPERSKGAAARPATKVRTVSDPATTPGRSGGSEGQGAAAASSRSSYWSGAGSGSGWSARRYWGYRSYLPGRHLPEAPATYVSRGSGPDGRPTRDPQPGSTQQYPDRRGTGSDPDAYGQQAAAVWAGGEEQPRRLAAALVRPAARFPDPPWRCGTARSCPPS